MLLRRLLDLRLRTKMACKLRLTQKPRKSMRDLGEQESQEESHMHLPVVCTLLGPPILCYAL